MPKLYPFQENAVRRMVELEQVLLFDDMGLGKTLEAIETTVRTNSLPALVIVPKRLVLNWKAEIQKWYPDQEPVVFENPNQFADAYFAQVDDRKLRFFIIWHDVLLQAVETGQFLADEIAETIFRLGWKTIIVDEAHKFRNDGTYKTTALLSFKPRKGQRRIVMTGTPVVNSAMDMYPLLRFLNLAPMEGWQFMERYTNRGNNNKPSGFKNRPELMGLIGTNWIRRTKLQVLKDLPAKTTQVINLEMTNGQRAAYDQLVTMMILELEDGGQIVIPSGGGFPALAMITRLRQIALDPRILGKHTQSAKTETILDMIEEHCNAEDAGKVIVYSNFVQYLNLLEDDIRERFLNFRVTRITGEESIHQAKANEDQFQTDPNTKVLLVSMGAGGEGLNLTAADLAIIADRWWNSARMEQALDRSHRIGQTRPLTAVTLHCTESVDDLIGGIVAEKEATAKDVLIGLIKQMMEQRPDLLKKLGISTELVVQ